MATRTSLGAASSHPGPATLRTAQHATDLIPADSAVLDALVERADADTSRIDEAMDLARVNTEAAWSGGAAEPSHQAMPGMWPTRRTLPDPARRFVTLWPSTAPQCGPH